MAMQLPEGNAESSESMERIIEAERKVFLSKYPVKAAWWKEIFRRCKLAGRCCGECGSAEIEHSGGRMARCRKCRTRFSFTAGTFFHRVRRPELWLFMLHLIELGTRFNCHVFHQVLGAAYSTVNVMFRKINVVIDDWRQGGVDAPTTCFRELVAKRSRSSIADSPLSAEEPTTDSFDDLSTPESELDTFMLESVDPNAGDTETVQTVLDQIGANPISADDLAERLHMDIGSVNAILTILDLEGLIVRLPGDRYQRAKRKSRITTAVSDAVRAACDRASQFIRSVFGGISRKYLSLYLALHSAYLEPTVWQSRSLFAVCMSYGPITYKQVMNIACPITVTVAVAKS